MKVNYHTHSIYCDGRGELRDYVEFALAHEFSHLGFSGHAPLPFENNYTIRSEEYIKYCNEIRSLQTEFADRINICLGLEIDYIPGVMDNFSELIINGRLDYCIGSVHIVNQPENPENMWFIDVKLLEKYHEGLQRVFGGDIRKGVQAFFQQTNEMIESQRPLIVGHLDKILTHNDGNRYFMPNEKWFQYLVFETVELIRQAGCICEINTRGIYKKRHEDFYPSRETIKYMNQKNIPVLVSTDAHEPANLDMFEGAYEYLREIGYRNVVYTIL